MGKRRRRPTGSVPAWATPPRAIGGSARRERAVDRRARSARRVHGRQVPDAVGARLLVLANTYVYHLGKQRLLARLRRFPVTYIVAGGSLPANLAPGSEHLAPMANDRLIAMTAGTRATISYPPNRQIGAIGSRLPNTLMVGAIPLTGITRAIAALPDLACGMIGFDHRFDGLEATMDRLLTHPDAMQEIAAAGPALAARHFEPGRFVDAMIALAA